MSFLTELSQSAFTMKMKKWKHDNLLKVDKKPYQNNVTDVVIVFLFLLGTLKRFDFFLYFHVDFGQVNIGFKNGFL